MTDKIAVGEKLDGKPLGSYFRSLVDRFFKILPMREDEEETLPVYLRSLQVELYGFQSMVPALSTNPKMISLLALLQFFIDNPDAPVEEVKREVFQSIDLCKKLSAEAKGGWQK